MKTIVLGYDDSESAVRALGRVTQLAKAFDASVVAVSAAPALVPPPTGSARSTRSIRPRCIESSSLTRRPYSTSWGSRRSTTSASVTPPT